MTFQEQLAAIASAGLEQLLRDALEVCYDEAYAAGFSAGHADGLVDGALGEEPAPVRTITAHPQFCENCESWDPSLGRLSSERGACRVHLIRVGRRESCKDWSRYGEPR